MVCQSAQNIGEKALKWKELFVQFSKLELLKICDKLVKKIGNLGLNGHRDSLLNMIREDKLCAKESFAC